MTAPLPSAGTLPLTGRLEPWMERLVNRPEECAQLLKQHGSPVNVHDFGPLERNIKELEDAANASGVDLKVYVARKANKTLGLVDAARKAGAGIDVSSKRELEQCLERGVPGSRLILTAAVKSPALLVTALKSMTMISVDNLDELEVVTNLARENGIEAQIALRIAVTSESIAPTRFGLSGETWLFALERLELRESLKIRGVHFHLNGYSAGERIVGLRQALQLVDGLVALGQDPSFIDMGGGIPMRYLESRQQWREFWRGLHSGVAPQGSGNAPQSSGNGQPGLAATAGLAAPLMLGNETVQSSTLATSCWGLPLSKPEGVEESADLAPLAPLAPLDPLAPLANTASTGSHTTGLTWRGDTFGLVDPEAERPSPNTYPFFQESIRGPWLSNVLAGDGFEADVTIANELIRRNLELRCEPGRSVLDGCGMTLAEVAFRKEASDHTPLVGLFMNRTQLRTTSADYLVDPIHVRPANASTPIPVGRGFLVGAYCIEDELIIRRAIDFPQGVARGDIFVFPNTAGYFMHIVESASHQLPLAVNLVFTPVVGGDLDDEVLPSPWVLDGIDAVNLAGG